LEINTIEKIETTRGRVHTFGRHIDSSEFQQRMLQWVCLQSHGFATGIYFENSSRIRNIGVSSDHESPLAPPVRPTYSVYQHMPFDVGALCHGAFKQHGFHVSTARLDALSVITICRVGDRCVGMQMQYLDGDMKVLGQWYPETESSYSCIFDNSQVYLKSLCFESTSGYFTDIRVLNGCEEPSSEAQQIFELGEVRAL
jgi:hypothetical protein